jgi:predicted porin
MKKSMIAIAALTAASGAFAQSSVTMYGVAEAVIDLGWKQTTDTSKETFNAAGVITSTSKTTASNKDAFRVQDGNSQGTGTSRIGWRGTEDLGGGFKANFQLEMGLRIDDGAAPGTTGVNSGSSGGTGLFGRNAWVGLSGGFGDIRLGRQRIGSYDIQGEGYAAGSNGLYDSASQVVPGIVGQRFNNAVKYISPNLGGVTGIVTIRAPEGGSGTSTTGPNAPNAVPVYATAETKNKVGWDVGLTYANGPLYLGVAYGKTNATSATNNGQSGPTPANVISGGTEPAKGYTLSANYNFGMIRPYFNYTRVNTVVDSFTKTGALLASTSTETTNKAWTLGARVPFGPLTLIAGYASGRSDVVGGTVTANVVSSRVAGDVPHKAFQFGAQYALSKRTLLEANLGARKRSSVTRTTAVPAGTGTIDIAVLKESALSVGIKHSF